jgi:hypothetical protein
MIKYICDWCEEEFVDLDEFEDHMDNCVKSPYHKSKSIPVYVFQMKVTIYDFKIVTSSKMITCNVFVNDDKYVEWVKESDDFSYERLFCIKENLDKVIMRTSCFSGEAIFQYKSLKTINVEEIKSELEEKINSFIEEKINQLIFAKNNLKFNYE